MALRVALLVLIILMVILVNWCILRFWWRSMMANDRWVLLFPVALPAIIFAPMFVVGPTAGWALPTISGWTAHFVILSWLLPTFIISLFYARRYDVHRLTMPVR